MRILYLIIFSIIMMVVNDFELLSIIFIIYIIGRAIHHYWHEKLISYMDIWNFAFIYIVISEVLLISKSVFDVNPMKFIFLTNILINIGFLIYKYKNSIPVNNSLIPKLNTKILFFLLLILAGYFYSSRIGKAMLVSELGRGNIMGSAEGGGTIQGFLTSALGNFIPIVTIFFYRYYYRYKHTVLVMLIVLLCIIPQIYWGTRYILLFSIVTPLIILLENRKINFNLILAGMTCIIGLIILNKNVRDYRSATVSDRVFHEEDLKNIASYGSNEGIVRGSYDIIEYTQTHNFSYGKESAFLLYFWIPRSLWPNKPTQLSYWLPRYKKNWSTAYSGAYGYWGELLMDFGYWSIIFYLPLGLLFAKLDSLKSSIAKGNISYNSMFYYLLVPVFFFGVRSPQTILISLFWVIVIFYFFRKFIIVYK